MDPAGWNIVRSAPLFGAMPVEAAQALIGNHGPRTYKKGAVLFRQGEPASAFFVTLSGWVKVYRTTPDGLEVVLNVFRTGETFAEPAMFLGGRYPASAETVSPARLLRIEGDTFRARIRERPELALAMLAAASHQVKSLVRQIEQIKVRSATQRIVEFIVQLTPRREGPARIELPFEKNLLAKRLGMTPESFSRALTRLRPLGVTVERETVRITDMSQLMRFVDYARNDGGC